METIKKLVEPICFADSVLVQGSMSYTNVYDFTVQNRVVTLNYMTGFQTISVPTGYLITVINYFDPETLAFIEGSAKNLQTIEAGKLNYVYRIGIKRADNANFTPNDLDRNRRGYTNEVNRTLDFLNSISLYQGGVDNNTGSFTNSTSHIRTDFIEKGRSVSTS